MINVNWDDLKNKLPFKRNPEEFKQRKNLWKQIDVNGNGYLSLAEVDKGLRDVLKCDQIFDCKPAIMRAFMSAKNIVKTKSKYGDDYVEFREFRLLLLNLRQYFEYYVAFSRIDKDFDRRIDLNEFTSAIPIIEVWIGEKITDAKKSFSEIDKNGGGKILFDEFCKWSIEKNLDLEDDDDYDKEG